MWNVLIPLLGTALSGALAGRSSGNKANPQQIFQQLFGQQLGLFQQQLAPVQQQLSQMAGRRGAALGQDLAGSLGAMGALSSGAGRAAFSLGQTATGALRTQAESQFRQQLVDMARISATQLLAPQQAFVESQRTGGENFQAWLAQIMSGGQLGGLLSMLPGKAGGGGQAGGTGINTQAILQNPNLMPINAPTNPALLGRGRGLGR